MKPLEINDKCYKFFFRDPKFKSGSRSAAYKENEIYYSQNGLYFFRRNEAVSSLKLLLYFFEYGDTLAEVIVDQTLIEEVYESSPDHFVSSNLKIGKVYSFTSREFIDLLMESLRNCKDFTIPRFEDVIIKLIKYGAFDTALNIYDTVCLEKNLKLSEKEMQCLMQLASQPWCKEVPLNEVQKCNTFHEFIDLMKVSVQIIL